MAEVKGMFIAENMASTTVGSLLRSAVQATEIENGKIVKLTTLKSPERHLYNAAPVAALTEKIVLIDGVELDYDESVTKGIEEFVNEANKPFRVRIPQVDDIFSVSEVSLTALAGDAVVVGNVVETPATGNKLLEKETASATASFVAKIVAKYNHGVRKVPMVRLEVVKA